LGGLVMVGILMRDRYFESHFTLSQPGLLPISQAFL